MVREDRLLLYPAIIDILTVTSSVTFWVEISRLGIVFLASSQGIEK
jgi:hypothetical protein